MDTALWALGRGTGVAALVLFTVSIVLGVLTRSGRPLPGLPRFAVTLVHRDVSLTATVFLLIHIVSLFFDSYAQLRRSSTRCSRSSPRTSRSGRASGRSPSISSSPWP
nr:hypothetical protein GCM10025699_76880 [Microbacterium flavescens]